MKILAFVPVTTGIYEDDTSMLIRGLEGHGCTVIKANINTEGRISILAPHNEQDVQKVDLIWAPYEPLIRPALYLKTILNVPVAGHYEQVPPGRVFFDKAYTHYISSTEPFDDKLYNAYKSFARDFSHCDIKTTTDISTLNRIELLLGLQLPGSIHIKPYPVDYDKIQKHISGVEEKYQIVSSMRLVDHKRHHHVIKALSLLKNAPKYIIIGDGPERETLEKMATELGVDVEFTGIISDTAKYQILESSMFGVYPWAWLGIGEMAAFGKTSIAYDRPDTRSRLGDTPYYVESENITALAGAIDYLSSNADARMKFGKTANATILGNCCTAPIPLAASKLLEIFKTVRK